MGYWDDVGDERIACHGNAWPHDENCGGGDEDG